MNKRGQFFLIATIIIVGLIIGITTSVNSITMKDDNEAFESLADEVNLETKSVLDYGSYNSADTDSLMQGFLENYTNYIAKEEILFIYGNETDITGLVFEENAGNVGINTGAIPGFVTIQYTTGQEAEVTRNGNTINVEINGLTYVFNLRDGQNFFFVMRETRNDEKFVETR